MAIPALEPDGHLPPGIHDVTWNEMEERFATNQARRELLAALRRYADEVVKWPLAEALLVDGSFVTSEPNPNDIDLILVLRADYDIAREVPPVEYNLRSTRMVRQDFGLDLFAVRPDSIQYQKLLTLFTSIRRQPHRSKGILRVEL